MKGMERKSSGETHSDPRLLSPAHREFLGLYLVATGELCWAENYVKTKAFILEMLSATG